MNDPSEKIVEFTCCKSCVHWAKKETEEPCSECLNYPANEWVNYPVYYEKVKKEKKTKKE